MVPGVDVVESARRSRKSSQIQQRQHLAPLLVLLLAGPAFADSDHQAPVKSLAEPSQSVDAQRQSLLAEMWQRRILSSESRSWSAEDLELLLKIRSAEALGAVPLVQRRGGAAGGSLVPYKAPGDKIQSWRLTREGYGRWQFLRAQEAIDYFERKGADAGQAFHLHDLEGRPLFDSSGMLTAAGDDVYDRALANLPTWWKSPHTGEIFGTRPPPKAAPAVDPGQLSVTIGPEHAPLVDQQYRAAWGIPYEPVLMRRRLGRLTIVEEHDPRFSGEPKLVAVVRAASDKAAARKEFSRRLPALGPLPAGSLLTKEEKLDSMSRSLTEVERKTGKKGYFSVDAAAVAKQLDADLKGSLCVVYVLLGPAPAAPPEPVEPPAPVPAAGEGAKAGAAPPTAPGAPASPETSGPPPEARP